MKQNEKILVFAVTGFLVVILLVAIIFGKDGPRVEEPQGGGSTLVRSLEDVLNDRAGNGVATRNPGEDKRMGSDAELAGDPDTAGLAAVDGDGSAGLSALPAPTDHVEADLVIGVPLAAMVPLLPPTPASLVTEKLGLSRREHDYRLVRARSGDSLGSLVQTWCGSTDPYLDDAHGLNEELSVLRIGQEVVLPWVDDEVILAAYERRQTVVRPADFVAVAADVRATSPGGVAPALSPVRATPVAVPSRKYKVQPGDSLWKIAERLVGRRAVPAYLKKVRSLNPGLDVDRLKVGQLVLLPTDK